MTIQEQLRKATVALALELPEAVYDDYSDIAFDSANRIDTLEAALRNIRGAPVGLDRPNVGISDLNVIVDMRRVAHQALEASS